MPHAVINITTATDTELVAAETGKRVKVTAMFIEGACDSFRLESGAGGAALTGTMNLGAEAPMVLPRNPDGWVLTAESAALSAETTGTTDLQGTLVYEYVN